VKRERERERWIQPVEAGDANTEYKETDDDSQRQDNENRRSCADDNQHTPTSTSSTSQTNHTATPDTTRQSCPCRVWLGCVTWTIAINVFRLQIFGRRQSSVVGNPVHTAEADATETRQFLSCLAWRCELALTCLKPSARLA